jgi:hypothetical protein
MTEVGGMILSVKFGSLYILGGGEKMIYLY